MNIFVRIWRQLQFTFERTKPEGSSRNIPCDVNGPGITYDEFLNHRQLIKVTSEYSSE